MARYLLVADLAAALAFSAAEWRRYLGRTPARGDTRYAWPVHETTDGRGAVLVNGDDLRAPSMSRLLAADAARLVSEVSIREPRP